MMSPQAFRKQPGRSAPAPAPGAPPRSGPAGPPPPAPARSSPLPHASEDELLPRLSVSGPALGALRWSARHSGDECCFWGVLEPAPGGLRLAEVVLARHQGSPGYSVPDMEWYGDLVAERHAASGLEPWQLACWIHTHPPGLDRPSGVDRATFLRHFGRQRLAVMLIMTHDLIFCGELSAHQPALADLPPARLANPLRITFEEPLAEAAPDEAERLARQHAERVSPLVAPGRSAGALGPEPLWLDLLDEDEGVEEEAWQDEVGPWPDGWTGNFGLDGFEQPRRRIFGRPHEVSRQELVAYACGFLTTDPLGRPAFDPAMAELELIAAGVGDPDMSVRQAARLRQRLQALDPQQIISREEEA